MRLLVFPTIEYLILMAHEVNIYPANGDNGEWGIEVRVSFFPNEGIENEQIFSRVFTAKEFIESSGGSSVIGPMRKFALEVRDKINAIKNK